MSESPPVRLGRSINGMSAVLLPYTRAGEADWAAGVAHVERTYRAGLTPAVNMDTGYVQLLSETDKLRMLDLTADATGGDFVAGAFVADTPGTAYDHAAYIKASRQISERGGVPVIFPSHGLTEQDEAGWLDSHRALGADIGRFIGFELGQMFVSYGRIVSLEAYEELLSIPECIGAKHSSLRRDHEWNRLALRDRIRPDFAVFTGNDLAIDMVMYGSDYLLGLSTIAPAEFAFRDQLWTAGNLDFYELNDLLQYLGQLTFRKPIPGYRHNAAQMFELRGWSSTSLTPPGVPQRPGSDVELLQGALDRLNELTERLGMTRKEGV